MTQSTVQPSKAQSSAPDAGSARTKVPQAGLRSEIGRLFEEFASGWPFDGGAFERHPWSRLPAAFHAPAPATDVVENGAAYVLRMDLPGVAEKDIEVNLSDGVISIRAEASEERKEEKESYYLSERQHGSMQRAFRVPAGVDTAKIEASYEKGVLTVVLPKTAEAQQKQRQIKVESR